MTVSTLMRTCLLIVMGWLTLACPVMAEPAQVKQADLDRLVDELLGFNASTTTIHDLRAAGPDALATLAGRLDASSAPADRRTLMHAMDEVAQQRYGHISRLYWYTDIQAAQRQAQATGRPILSLRLLGNLTEEYSCANSRYFRVILYADPKVNAYLRENFILHWQSVRDVPQVTITLADGQTLRRTVTGNSMHVVLDTTGRAVDAIPGLWHADAFLKELQASRDLAVKVSAGSFNPQPVIDWHRRRMQEINEQLERELASINLTRADLENQMIVQTLARKEEAFRAEQVMTRAMSKAVVEAPMLQSIRLVNVREMWQRLDDANWRKFVSSRQEAVTLSDNTLALIRGEVGDEQAKAIKQTLTQSLAADTAFNRFVLRMEIHRLFAAGPRVMRFSDGGNSMTTMIYRDILGMDLNDPWAGLHDPSVYTGLDHGGLQVVQRVSQMPR